MENKLPITRIFICNNQDAWVPIPQLQPQHFSQTCGCVKASTSLKLHPKLALQTNGICPVTIKSLIFMHTHQILSETISRRPTAMNNFYKTKHCRTVPKEKKLS